MVNTRQLGRSGRLVDNSKAIHSMEMKRKFTVYSIIPDAFVTLRAPNRNWQQHIRRQFNFEYSLPPNIQYSEVLLDGNKYWAQDIVHDVENVRYSDSPIDTFMQLASFSDDDETIIFFSSPFNKLNLTTLPKIDSSNNFICLEDLQTSEISIKLTPGEEYLKDKILENFSPKEAENWVTIYEQFSCKNDNFITSGRVMKQLYKWYTVKTQAVSTVTKIMDERNPHVKKTWTEEYNNMKKSYIYTNQAYTTKLEEQLIPTIDTGGSFTKFLHFNPKWADDAAFIKMDVDSILESLNRLKIDYRSLDKTDLYDSISPLETIRLFSAKPKTQPIMDLPKQYRTNFTQDNILYKSLPKGKLCQSGDYLILVKSSRGELTERKRVRTYHEEMKDGSYHYDLYFLLGEKATQDGVYRDGFGNHDQLEISLQAEQKDYNDLIIGAFEDSYENLPLKTFLGFQFYYDYCSEGQMEKKLTVFHDSDAFVVMPLVHYDVSHLDYFTKTKRDVKIDPRHPPFPPNMDPFGKIQAKMNTYSKHDPRYDSRFGAVAPAATNFENYKYGDFSSRHLKSGTAAVYCLKGKKIEYRPITTSVYTSKWWINRQMWDPKYELPSHCNGNCNSLTHTAMLRIYKAAKSTNWNGMRVEDRLFTGILRRKAGIANLISTFEVMGP